MQALLDIYILENTFFTSDSHFNHQNIIKYAKRPFTSVEDMNEKLIENWNNTVGQYDTVWCLGDFAFMKAENIRQLLLRLNGIKCLVLGNHDKEIVNNKPLLTGPQLFKLIVPYYELTLNNQFITMFHYAGRTWNKSHHGSWQLYGHTHGTLPPLGKSVDVGVDSPYITGKAEYRPFSFDEIKRFMDKQQITMQENNHKVKHNER